MLSCSIFHRVAMDKLLDKVYYGCDSPAAFTGVSVVYREAKRHDPKIKYSDVVEYMQKQDTYTLHKPIQHNFSRNRVVATGIDSHWQADLCDMKSLRKYNDSVGYLLTVIDVLSKTGWAVPTKVKTPEAVRDAFASILTESGRIPAYLFTDCGKEFIGSPFQKFLKLNGIEHITSRDPNVKASVAERYNRTLKTRIWKYMTKNNSNRYIDDLQKIVTGINHSFHRMIKMRPVDVCTKNENEVWQNLYGDTVKRSKDFKFSVADKVRISKYKHVFEKGYLPNFTEEIFEIAECIARQPPVYRLKDLNGDPIEGVFYDQELVKVIKDDEDEVYKIEKVLKTRTIRGIKELFVKWKGYPNKFNQWIPQTDVVSVM